MSTYRKFVYILKMVIKKMRGVCALCALEVLALKVLIIELADTYFFTIFRKDFKNVNSINKLNQACLLYFVLQANWTKLVS